jgi:hypothetical protein
METDNDSHAVRRMKRQDCQGRQEKPASITSKGLRGIVHAQQGVLIFEPDEKKAAGSSLGIASGEPVKPSQGANDPDRAGVG